MNLPRPFLMTASEEYTDTTTAMISNESVPPPLFSLDYSVLDLSHFQLDDER